MQEIAKGITMPSDQAHIGNKCERLATTILKEEYGWRDPIQTENHYQTLARILPFWSQTRRGKDIIGLDADGNVKREEVKCATTVYGSRISIPSVHIDPKPYIEDLKESTDGVLIIAVNDRELFETYSTTPDDILNKGFFTKRAIYLNRSDFTPTKYTLDDLYRTPSTSKEELIDDDNRLSKYALNICKDEWNKPKVQDYIQLAKDRPDVYNLEKIMRRRAACLERSV